MRIGGRRWDDALEDGLESVLAAGRAWWAWRRAARLLDGKERLRGRACHCRPDLATHFVHSEGLREAADVVVDYDSNVICPGRPQFPVEALARVAPDIGDGDIVHVKTDRLPAFIAHVLPRLGGPIVLVTGDSDVAPMRPFGHLLDHPLIIHWFVQNCDREGRHPRLTRIPIGFDNPDYGKLDKRLGFALAMIAGKAPFDPAFRRNDIGDQTLFERVRATIATDPARKRPLALCTFHQNQRFRPNFQEVPERAEAYAVLKDNPACHFVPRRLSQEACWRAHTDFAFEVCPRGNGLDCFRQWEALALGVIPIVRTSTLDPLYQDEDLPVVIVDSFEEITPSRLEAWHEALSPTFTPELTRRLSNAYWAAKPRAVQARWRNRA